MKLVKEIVCASCHSPGISDANCICVWENKYPTIELEFEQCECCGHVSETPADSEFNRQQLEEENFEEDLDDVEDH